MHFQIYVPNCVGFSGQVFRERGLGLLLREGDRTPTIHELIHVGPDGKTGGTVYDWGTPRPGYHTEDDTWKWHNAGSYWVGINSKSPPTPADLTRPQAARCDGFAIELGDQNVWAFPNALAIPVRFMLDENGSRTSKPVRRLEDLNARTLWAFGVLEKYLRDEGPIPDVDEGLRYCAEVLAVNYRVTHEICLLLGLFDQENLLPVMTRSTDIDRLRSIEAEIKKKRREAASAPTQTG